MDQKQKEYKVTITKSAEKAFFEVIDYVLNFYTEERTLEIAEDLRLTPLSLKILPSRGRIEDNLLGRKHQFRFILYRQTNSVTVKIIYYVDELEQEVFIVDYFPTKMDPIKISKRAD